MHEDFMAWLEKHRGREYDLHSEHVNPAFVKMLRAIGFDRGYVRGEGSHLWDADGNKYLDLLTGWGVFALGRNHPKVRAILQQLLSQDSPNLVRMDCSLLSGLVAEKLTSHTGGDLSRVFFTNSGTETVETSIKFARCADRSPGNYFLRPWFPWAHHRLTGGQRRGFLSRTFRRADARHHQGPFQRSGFAGRSAGEKDRRSFHPGAVAGQEL